MPRFLKLFAVGALLVLPAVAQRGGGFHGGMGGGFHGGMGGGFHGGMGGGFHGGLGGGFHGGVGQHSYGGFHNGFYHGPRAYWGFYPWGYWPSYYAGWGYPYYNGYYYYPYSAYSYPYYDYGYGGSNQDQALWPPASQKTIYLIKLKGQDNVCMAQAYWYTEQTLHFITLEGENKQVPTSSIDRALTLQLNAERHVDFQLPATR